MSLSSVVHKVAPWIATAASIAAPGATPIIQLAAKALSTGLGATVTPDAKSIENAITTAMANPEQLATLKKIDSDFAVQMQQIGFQEVTDLAKIDADDRADARAMEVKTGDKWTPRILLIFVCTAWCAIQGFILWHAFGGAPEMTPVSAQTVGAISRMSDSALTLALGFYWGSSAGSAEKNAIIATQVNANGSH